MQATYFPSANSASAAQINLEVYRVRIYNYILKRITINRDEADDITQETLIRAYQNINQLRAVEKIFVWLCSIAKNLNSDKYKKRTDTLLDDMVDNLEDSHIVEDRICTPENLDGEIFMRNVFDTLSDKHKEILELRAEKLPYEDIAVTLRIPIGTVRSRLHQARYSFKERLEQEGVYIRA